MTGRPDMSAIGRRYEWGCDEVQCTDDRGTMLVWIGELERELEAARRALDMELEYALDSLRVQVLGSVARTYWEGRVRDLRAALACGGGEG